MNNYRYKKIEKQFHIIEIPTGNTVEIVNSLEECKDIMKHLNNGGGFAGSTPIFFCKSPRLQAH